MTRDEFRVVAEKMRAAHPMWFDLPSDAPPSQDEIDEIERQLNLTLPSDFVWFLKEYGGGDFAFATIYSADRGSRSHLLRRQEDVQPSDFVAVTDNGAGDLFGFRADDGVLGDEVYFFDHETETVSSAADDFLTFVKDRAFRGNA